MTYNAYTNSEELTYPPYLKFELSVNEGCFTLIKDERYNGESNKVEWKVVYQYNSSSHVF